MRDGQYERNAVAALQLLTSGIPWRTIVDLIFHAGSAQAVVDGSWDGFSPPQRVQAERIVDSVESTCDRVEDAFARLQQAGVSVITVADSAYPIALSAARNPPPVLFVKGTLLPIDHHGVAIVGTRNPTERGLADARRFAGDLAANGITIVSGLAMGIDAAAHDEALAAGTRTIAVLGTGILAPTYPEVNADLAQRICSHGALISEFWPDARGTRQTFPIRNAVIAGMSRCTLVVEAGVKSGAWLTVGFAREANRPVYLAQNALLDDSTGNTTMEVWASERSQLNTWTAATGADVMRGLCAPLVIHARQFPVQRSLSLSI